MDDDQPPGCCLVIVVVQHDPLSSEAKSIMIFMAAADCSFFGFRTAFVVVMGRLVCACGFLGSAANDIIIINWLLEGVGAAARNKSLTFLGKLPVCLSTTSVRKAVRVSVAV
jgi:hypothetical protein